MIESVTTTREYTFGDFKVIFRDGERFATLWINGNTARMTEPELNNAAREFAKLAARIKESLTPIE